MLSNDIHSQSNNWETHFINDTIKIEYSFKTCEFSSTGHSTTGYVACNIQGVSLAKSLASSSLGITIGIGEFNLLGESWLQYTPASGINANVINARNKPIGRTLIYELPGYCFGIITTLGDDKDVIQNTFCKSFREIS